MSSGGPPDKRAGDATLSRIDELADGWGGKAASATAAAGDDSATEPVEKVSAADLGSGSPGPGRPKRPTMPPPPPPGRRKSPAPPPAPASARRKSSSTAPAPPRTKAPSTAPPPLPRAKRPSAGPPPPPPGRRESPAVEAELAPVAGIIESTNGPREDEETQLAPPKERPQLAGDDAPLRRRRVGNNTGSLRLPETLPRRPGLVGDMLYVWTSMFGVARARRELSSVERKLGEKKERRHEQVIELARTALADADMASPTLEHAREVWVAREEKRSHTAGAIAAADEEIGNFERSRTESQSEYEKEAAVLRRDIENMEEKLEPLGRRVHAARRKAKRFQDDLAELDRRIRVKEVALAHADDRSTEADIEAELAGLRAEREGLADDEPAIAADIDELEPLIANLIASRGSARERTAELEQLIVEVGERADEQIAAVRAQRIVNQRLQRDLERDQLKDLRQLGERLGVERTGGVATLLFPIEDTELACATLQRRQHELSELVKGVDRGALVRGWALWTVIGLALGAALWFLR